MLSNIEIKVEAPDLDAVAARALALGGTPAQVLEQEDTFFKVPAGRLKIRKLSPTLGELIYYKRPDVAGPKQCHYLIARTAEPDALVTTLAAALGVAGVVRKTRRLHLVGQTRVHLDSVERLGTYVELEVVLRPGQAAAEGEAIARELLCALGLADARHIAGAYFDLLTGAPASAQSPE